MRAQKSNILFAPMTILFGLILALGCVTSGSRSNQYKEDSDQPLVDPKYRLSADRKALDQMRSEVPNDKKAENDELALVLGLLTEVKKQPSEIREKYNSVLKKKRETFDKDIKKEREVFTRDERKARDVFMKKLADDRNSFTKSKPDREAKTEYFKELDLKRTDFFSTERDRRADFESDVRERRKNFEDYVKEKQNDFNSEMRDYQKRYDEMKKLKREEEKEKAKNPNYRSEGDLDPASTAAIQARVSSVGPSAADVSEMQNLEEELMKYQGQPAKKLQSGE